MKNSTIEKLIEMGASRWTKGDKDRLYLNGAACAIIGLELSYYKSGSISYAALKGETISNSKGGKIACEASSMYIDLTTGSIWSRASDEIVEEVRAWIIAEEAEEPEAAVESSTEEYTFDEIDTVDEAVDMANRTNGRWIDLTITKALCSFSGMSKAFDIVFGEFSKEHADFLRSHTKSAHIPGPFEEEIHPDTGEPVLWASKMFDVDRDFESRFEDLFYAAASVLGVELGSGWKR